MAEITDDYMQGVLKTTRPYTVVILRATVKRNEPGADKIVWEHGRRNFVLRSDGRLCIVCPATDEGDVSGLYIFRTDATETRKIMDEDPAVKAGIFRYFIHCVRSFPGDSLTK
jgi:hypothetical protein